VTPSYVIREAAAADLECCAALAYVATPERSSSAWNDSLRLDVESPERLLVVAEWEGTIVGYGRARLFEPAPDAPADTAPRGYYLTGVFVVSDRRGGGIGTALTRGRLDWIRERAADAWYFANARNAVSIELHRRLGFEEVTRRFSFPGLTFEGGEGILFRLRLRTVRAARQEP
jgi:ribosomal protein S18 acetylase RimI-like enzyme